MNPFLPRRRDRSRCLLPLRSAALAASVAAAGLLFTAGCGPSNGPAGGANTSTPPAPPAATATATATAGAAGASTNASPAAVPSGDLAKVVGRWLRPDGGYILDLRDLDAGSGRLNATYLNPQPIHVARAEAKLDAGKATVFVELQDVNYPGCTYRLSYFPASDQLYGVYYQAAIGQSFDVEFVRQKQ